MGQRRFQKYRIWVSSSETSHRRRANSGLWDSGLERVLRGYPCWPKTDPVRCIPTADGGAGGGVQGGQGAHLGLCAMIGFSSLKKVVVCCRLVAA